MVGKLVTLVALFTLVLAAASFASPETGDVVAEQAMEAGEGELADRLGDKAEEEAEFELYLGPLGQEEIITEVDDRHVD